MFFYHPAPTYLSLNIIQYILSSEVYNTKLHNKFQSVVVALHFFCYTAHIIVHSINTTCHCTHGMCCCFFDSRILLYHGANLSKTNWEVEEAGGVNNHTVYSTVLYHDSTIRLVLFEVVADSQFPPRVELSELIPTFRNWFRLFGIDSDNCRDCSFLNEINHACVLDWYGNNNAEEQIKRCEEKRRVPLYSLYCNRLATSIR